MLVDGDKLLPPLPCGTNDASAPMIARSSGASRICLGVAQMDDVDVSGRQRWLVELRDQILRELKPLRTRRADDDRIGAWLGQNRNALARVSWLGRLHAHLRRARD